MKRLALLFLVVLLSVPAWGAYLYNTPITVSGTMVGSGGPFSNHTLYLHLSGNQFKAVGGHIQNTVSVNGETVPADFVFSPNANGTSPYNFAIKQWNQSTGDIWGYATIPSLSSSGITFYAAYDDATVTTNQSPAAPFDSSTAGYWPLGNGATINDNDFTGHGRTLSSQNQTLTAASGQFDGSVTFSDQSYADCGAMEATSAVFSTPAAMTVSILAYVTNPNWNSYNGILIGDNTGGLGGTNVGWGLTLGSSENIKFAWSNQSNGTLSATSNTNAYTLNAWHLFQVRWDGTTSASNIHIYVDGTEVTYAGTTTYTTLGTTNTVTSIDSSWQFFWGSASDARIDTTERSVGWITTVSNNLMSYGTYVTQGTEASSGGGSTSIRVIPYIM